VRRDRERREADVRFVALRNADERRFLPARTRWHKVDGGEAANQLFRPRRGKARRTACRTRACVPRSGMSLKWTTPTRSSLSSTT